MPQGSWTVLVLRGTMSPKERLLENADARQREFQATRCPRTCWQGRGRRQPSGECSREAPTSRWCCASAPRPPLRQAFPPPTDAWRGRCRGVGGPPLAGCAWLGQSEGTRRCGGAGERGGVCAGEQLRVNPSKSAALLSMSRFFRQVKGTGQAPGP